MAMPAKTVVIYAKHMQFRKELLIAHNVLRRALERIIERAPFVEQQQQKDFLLFCSTFLEMLHDHHTTEDTVIVPLLVKACEIDDKVRFQMEAEHTTIMKRIATFQDALQHRKYNGDSIAVAGLTMKQDLLRHLAFEEAVFDITVIARASTAVIDEIHVAMEGETKKMNPFTVLPFLISHLTPEETDLMVFKASSWFLKSFLFPLVFSKKHKKAWAFAAVPQMAVSA